PETRAMSRALRSAGEARRGPFGNLAPFALGVPIGIGLLVALSNGAIDQPVLQHYTSRPVEQAAVVMFCCAMAGLAGKLLRYLSERVALMRPPLPEWDGQPIPAAQVGTLQQQFAAQPARRRGTSLGRRIGAVLDFVACRGSAQDLDDQLRCLADNDVMA